VKSGFDAWHGKGLF